MSNPHKSAEKCEECRYFVAKSGECLRYPPQMVYDDTQNKFLSLFPNVAPEEWCGEFEKP